MNETVTYENEFYQIVTLMMINPIFPFIMRIRFNIIKMRNKIRSLLCLVAVLLVISEAKTPTEQLDETLSALMKSASLMGMQYQITNKTHTLYNRNFGFRDGTHEV